MPKMTFLVGDTRQLRQKAWSGEEDWLANVLPHEAQVEMLTSPEIFLKGIH